ncbi:MAG: NmrA family NAD(P)-binding protein [Solirubrobacteraceae bacterium]
MILITTPGKVGREAARLLAETDTAVRLLARDPSTVTDLQAQGVEVVAGDLEDDASVHAALCDIANVILVSPAIPEQELRVIKAATHTGVEHVVKITSKASADSPIARRRGQAQIEAGLAASGLQYTLLRNNAYMQNFLMFAPAIAKTASFGSSAADGRVGLIDSRDVAAVAAQIARAPKTHVGQTYWPTGPQLLTYSDVAKILSEEIGRPFTFHARTLDEDRQAMIAAGVPEPIAEQNAQAFSLIAAGDAEWLSGDIERILGHPGRTFAEFAHDHASAFKPRAATQQA